MDSTSLGLLAVLVGMNVENKLIERIKAKAVCCQGV